MILGIPHSIHSIVRSEIIQTIVTEDKLNKNMTLGMVHPKYDWKISVSERNLDWETNHQTAKKKFLHSGDGGK